jgi:type I restriction enzyme M protein
MKLSRISRTSDHFGRYYTQQSVAALLVRSMALESAGLVIDLGAGDGALVSEAWRMWDRARFVTVDIDGTASSIHLAGITGAGHTHHIGDALDRDLDKKIGIGYGAVDSALCNPPYLRPRWRRHFADILEDAGLSDVVPEFSALPADILFIAQNLRFLRQGGKLGLILPDGLIAGEKYMRLRQTLATEHQLERVIELPRGIFKRTDAKAHIVVLAKRAPTSEPIRVQRLDVSGELTPAIEIEPSAASLRLDYSYLEARDDLRKRESRTRRQTLAHIARLVSRGVYSSASLRQCPFPVFHTTDFGAELVEVPRSFTLSKRGLAQAAGVIAMPGDILVARIGRNLEQKICKVTHGPIAISDCILLLRVAPAHQTNVFRYLRSNPGRLAIRSASHGVGARFITPQALLQLQI